MDMRRLGRGTLIGLVLGVGVLATACGDDDSNDTNEVTNNPDAGDGGGPGTTPDAATPRTDASTPTGDASTSQPDIVQTALADGRFKTLAKALTDANLVATLQGAGPFTVFAPTDQAFEALSQGALASLSPEQLRAVLLYHVVPGDLPSTVLKAGPVKTAADLTAFVSTTGGVKVNGASVTTADVKAKNGVIHVIDKVLLPPNLVQAATYAGSFSSLISAVTKAGLAETLSAPSANLTVFAPTDAAFAALPAGTVDSLSTSQLADVLKYHVVSGRVLSTSLTAGSVPSLLTGKNLTISLTGGVKVNDASVVVADVLTTNGVIHVIDKVLLPAP